MSIICIQSFLIPYIYSFFLLFSSCYAVLTWILSYLYSYTVVYIKHVKENMHFFPSKIMCLMLGILKANKNKIQNLLQDSVRVCFHLCPYVTQAKWFCSKILTLFILDSHSQFIFILKLLCSTWAKGDYMQWQVPGPHLFSVFKETGQIRAASLLSLKEAFMAMFRDRLREARNTGLCLMMVLVCFPN